MSTNAYRNPADNTAGQTTTSDAEVVRLPVAYRQRPDDVDAPATKPARIKGASKPAKPKARKYALADTIKADFNLSRPARELGVYLAGLVDVEEVFVFTSHARIGKDLGMSARTVRRRAKELQDAGYFARQLRASAWHGNHYHPQFNMISDPEYATDPAAPDAGGSSGTSYQNRYQVPLDAAKNDRMSGQEWPHHEDRNGRTMRPKLAAILQEDTLGDSKPTSEREREDEDNGAIDADAPPPSLCPRDASLKEEPASPKGVPLPGYDSETFAGHLPSFATKWPEAEPRRYIPQEEVIEWCDTLACGWHGANHDVRGAVAELMMLGWSLDQLADPMEEYNHHMLELNTYTMRLISYLGQEFDLGGKHVKAWEDRQSEREKRHRVNTEAPTISEKPVSEAAIAALVTSEPVIRELDAIKVEPVVTIETKWGEPAWDDREGDDEDLTPDDAPQTEADCQAAAERKARVDAIAVTTPAERKALMDKVFKESREKRLRMQAEREAAETPYERSKREAAEDIERRKKEQAEFKRQKAEADQVSKATSPASAYPLSAPSGKGGGLRRLSDYAEVPS